MDFELKPEILPYCNIVFGLLNQLSLFRCITIDISPFMVIILKKFISFYPVYHCFCYDFGCKFTFFKSLYNHTVNVRYQYISFNDRPNECLLEKRSLFHVNHSPRYYYPPFYLKGLLTIFILNSVNF